jgi:hypothetical protein
MIKFVHKFEQFYFNIFSHFGCINVFEPMKNFFAVYIDLFSTVYCLDPDGSTFFYQSRDLVST